MGWKLSDLEKVKKNGLKVFSCFSCGGGSTMGYKMAGYDVIGGNEIDKRMAELYRLNHNPKYFYTEDVRDFVKRTDLPEELYDLDILDGSPPCAPFSMAGHREDTWGKQKKFAEGQKYQILDDLFFEFIKVADKLKPKVVVAENVEGLIKGAARGYVNEIIKGFNAAGYEVQMFLLDASKMGVPQKRRRVFFICRLKSLGWPQIIMEFNEKPITFGEVRSKTGRENNEYAISVLKYKIPSDTDFADIKMRISSINSDFSRKILWDDCPTQTLNTYTQAFIRACDDMQVSIHDMIAIATFPEDFNFGAKNIHTKTAFLTGMSVPPIMMERIATQIYRQWFEPQAETEQGMASNNRKPKRSRALSEGCING